MQSQRAKDLYVCRMQASPPSGWSDLHTTSPFMPRTMTAGEIALYTGLPDTLISGGRAQIDFSAVGSHQPEI